jgi:uncharacterized protein (DUF927 family)
VPVLKVDNKSAITLIKNLVFAGQPRHIEVKYHLVRKSDARGQISVEFIGTGDQLGNILTKCSEGLSFGSCTQESASLILLSNMSRLRRRVLAINLACLGIRFSSVFLCYLAG